MTVRRVVLEITGQVQGVGFRYRVLQIAGRFDVAGSVRNLRNGALEVDAEGEEDEVARFIASVLENPPHSAQVAGTVQREEPPRYVSGFTVSP